jgi:hypothetical protein
LFLLISLRFLTSITTGTSGTVAASRLLGTVVHSTSTYFSLRYYIDPVSSSTLLLRSLRYLLYFSASTSTESAVLRYVSTCGYFLFVLWSGTVYSLPFLLFTVNLLSLLCTYYSSQDGVLCFLSLFISLSTPATLDTLNLFLCPNPALSFTVVSI